MLIFPDFSANFRVGYISSALNQRENNGKEFNFGGNWRRRERFVPFDRKKIKTSCFTIFSYLSCLDRALAPSS